MVYAYMWDKTLRYDVKARTWHDLEAKPRDKCKLWGSMCYDPVNKEILHSGGDGGSNEISTWTYSIEKNEWRKLEFGSARFNELHTKAKKLCWQAKTLLERAECEGHAYRHQLDKHNRVGFATVPQSHQQGGAWAADPPS